MLVGSNAAWCRPVLHQRLLAAKAAHGTKIVVIEARRRRRAERRRSASADRLGRRLERGLLRCRQAERPALAQAPAMAATKACVGSATRWQRWGCRRASRAGHRAAPCGNYCGARRGLRRAASSFALKGFHYSPLGLRDGILAQMLAAQERAPGAREFELERWQSVLATARRYGVDPKQVEPVGGQRFALFRWKRGGRLPRSAKAGCRPPRLHQRYGKFINHQGHHRGALIIVSSSELYGYTRAAQPARPGCATLGKSRPSRSWRAAERSGRGPRDAVRAVVLLRLAVALNQDRASDVLRVRGKGLSQAGLS